MNDLRVLLADDHALVRAGMRALLGELAGVDVIAETGDGHEALQLIRERKPDIALMDISMPGLNGLEVAARAVQDHPATRVIIVSMHADDESVRRALVAGAAGYLLKNSDRSELELALRTVARGDTWLSPSLTKRVVAAYTQSSRPASDGPLAVLTPRQREVLQLVAEGHSNKAIASRLNVALKTVETHRTELMERLGIHGVAGLVRYAIQVGLVDPDAQVVVPANLGSTPDFAVQSPPVALHTRGRTDLKVLFMSGYAEDAIVQRGVLAPNTAFINKPFSRDNLAAKVREVLDNTRAPSLRNKQGNPDSSS